MSGGGWLQPIQPLRQANAFDERALNAVPSGGLRAGLFLKDPSGKGREAAQSMATIIREGTGSVGALGELVGDIDAVTNQPLTSSDKTWRLFGIVAGTGVIGGVLGRFGKLGGHADEAADALNAAAKVGDDVAENAKFAAPKGLLSGNVIVKESKWDYFFGRVASNPHNQARSLQNLKDLKTLGFEDNAAGRLGLTKLFEIGRHGEEISRHTTQFGITITRRVPAGNKGVIEVKYFYPGGDLNAIPEISTIIPKIFP